MSNLRAIYDKACEINDKLDALPNLLEVARTQVNITCLDELGENLGLIKAGEFRAGNNRMPGDSFSGIRIRFPAMHYPSTSVAGTDAYNIVGVDADTMQFGLRSSDGVAVFGGGAAELDREGIKLIDTADAPAFHALAQDATISGEALGAGDVLIGNNSDTQPNILWDASAGKIYFREGTQANAEVEGGVVKSYACRAYYYESTGLPWDNSSMDPISYNIEDYDDADFFTSDAPTKFTIPAGMAGTYQIGISANWYESTAGARVASLGINGTYWYNPTDIRQGVPSDHTWGCAVHERDLSSGDYLELYLRQTSGGSLNLSAASMWIRKVR